LSIKLVEAILKLSMDDLYIFMSIFEKQTDDFKTLIKAWDSYLDKKDVTREVIEAQIEI
jgi:hypothetical protein